MCLSCIENVFPKGTFGTLQETILTTVNNKCYVLGAAGKQHTSSEHITHFIFAWFCIYYCADWKPYRKVYTCENFRLGFCAMAKCGHLQVSCNHWVC